MELKNKTLGNILGCAAATLMAAGAVFVFSASARINAEYDLTKFYNYPEFRQIIFVLISITILFATASINYKIFSFKSLKAKHWLSNPALWLIVLSIILLVLVLIPGIGTEINYARRWLRIPMGAVTLNFQPSELAKWAMVIFIPALAAAMKDNIKSFKKSFIPVCLLIGLVVGLIVIEDFGTAVFVAFISLIIFFIAGAKWWHFLTPMPFLAAAFFLAIVSSPERMERLQSYFQPAEKTAQSSGYQIRQSLIAISTGSITGKGLGKGISKYGHLPEDTTDFIFAIIAEELGFVGVCFLVSVFLLLLIIGIMIINRTDEPFGKLLVFGIILTVSFQAAVNLGVVTKLLPTKGIALPLISAGGSHLFLTSFAIGMAVSAARRNSE